MPKAPQSRSGVALGERWKAPDHWHHLSHRNLMRRPEDVTRVPGYRRPLDAVVVPASRRPHHLVHAARTARLAECHLLVLCSGKAWVAWVFVVVTRILPRSQVTVAQLPNDLVLRGLDLRADASDLTRRRESDTSLKRNLAIAVARMCGWSRILFMDDDVRGFGMPQLRVLEDVLACRQNAPAAVAWAFEDFPDNSVVCHANRRAGAPQDTFAGGGALAVRVDVSVPHFPLLYNEDWLFMLPLLWQQPSGLVLAGCLRQKPFDPYRDPGDAIRQELGDVIAETLFGLVQRQLGAGDPESFLRDAKRASFWKLALCHRRRLVVSVRSRLAEASDDVARRACAALDRVLEMEHKSGDWPRKLSAWVSAWQGDVVRWREWLGTLPFMPSPAEALLWCGVTPYVGWRPSDCLGWRRPAGDASEASAPQSWDRSSGNTRNVGGEDAETSDLAVAGL